MLQSTPMRWLLMSRAPAISTLPRLYLAKFQCGWYQYVHRWEFHGDGEIHPHLGMGGMLNPNDPTKGHTHHMYFRVDLDIDGFSSDVFEIFDHKTYLDPGGDEGRSSRSRVSTWPILRVRASFASATSKALALKVTYVATRSSYLNSPRSTPEARATFG